MPVPVFPVINTREQLGKIKVEDFPTVVEMTPWTVRRIRGDKFHFASNFHESIVDLGSHLLLRDTARFHGGCNSGRTMDGALPAKRWGGYGGDADSVPQHTRKGFDVRNDCPPPYYEAAVDVSS